MRGSALVAGLVFALLSPTARGDDRSWLQRMAEHTPAPRRPVEHSAERAGYPLSVSKIAISSVTRFDHGGYIGGGSLWKNNRVAHGPATATGPVSTGVFGTDYAGVRAHLGRVFLAPSTDPARGRPISFAYLAEGPRLPDPLALRPFRKAVLAEREAREGKEHAGEGGHGSESGHDGKVGE
jgi:hypothetical protein